MKTTPIRYGLAGLLALAACGGSGDKAQTMPAATTNPQPAETTASGGTPHLVLAEMTLFQGNTPMLKIHANGTTELAVMTKSKDGAATASWSPGPSVRTDGTFSMNGHDLARIDADGTLHNLRTSETIKFEVGDDSLSLKQGDQTVTMHLAEDGTLSVDGAPAMAAKVTGATNADQRRTALLIIGSLFMSAQHKGAPSASTSAPAAAAPAAAAPATPPKPAPAPAPAK